VVAVSHLPRAGLGNESNNSCAGLPGGLRVR
jgi:hypothetical protein